MPNNSTKDDIAFMLKQFKPERFAYLSVSIASFILLLVCIIIFITNTKNEMNEKSIGLIAGMAGSGGAIAYTASQLLRMWRDCMDLLKNLTKQDKHE